MGARPMPVAPTISAIIPMASMRARDGFIEVESTNAMRKGWRQSERGAERPHSKTWRSRAALFTLNGWEWCNAQARADARPPSLFVDERYGISRTWRRFG